MIYIYTFTTFNHTASANNAITKKAVQQGGLLNLALTFWLYVESKIDDIAVLHNIFFAFDAGEAFF